MTTSLTPLIVTNGDAARQVLEEAGIPADIMSWDDVLYEGPVPQTDDDESLRIVRANFISSRGWGDEMVTLARFEKRDRQLLSAAAHREIVLWFEHDLYDQLQCWQILSMLPAVAHVTAIVTDDFVTNHDALQLQRLWPERQPVGASMRQNVNRLWDAFREPAPHVLLDLLNIDVPFARATIERWIGLYPDIRSGLDRIEAFVLDRLKEGPMAFGALFRETLAMEEAPFMGDSSFMVMLKELRNGNEALLDIDGEEDPRTARVSLVSGGLDHLLARSGPRVPIRERWVGGVHIASGNWWFWDSVSREFCLRTSV